MSQYFSKPNEPFEGDINFKVDLSNYVTKTDLNNATGVDTSQWASKSDFPSLIAEVDKIDFYKSNTALVVSKLSNVVNNDVVTKCV